MLLADLLSECYAVEFEETWERERTGTPVSVLAARLYATDGSLRETRVILLMGVEHTHRAI